MFRWSFLLSVLFVFITGSVQASAPLNPVVKKYLSDLGVKAKKEDPGFVGFDAARGKELYFKEHLHSKKQKQRSCATCHTKDPSLSGKHAKSGKKIKPLSPIVNRKRFTKVKKIEKWFKRNCKWTLERKCSTQEKGDFIEYIYSL